MKIQLVVQPIAEAPSQWLILGLFEDEVEVPRGLEQTALAATIGRLLAEKEVSGTLAEMAAIYEPGGIAAGAVLLVGLGPRGRFDAGAAFTAGVAAAKRLAGKARDSVAILLPAAGDPAAIASAMVEGLVVGTRSSGLRKTEPNRHPFGTLSLVVPPEQAPKPHAALEASLRRGEIVGQAVNLARDLANTPPAEKSPAKLADRIRLVAEDAGLAVDIWDAERDRAASGSAGLLGVAAGSDEPPRFVVLRPPIGAAIRPRWPWSARG